MQTTEQTAATESNVTAHIDEATAAPAAAPASAAEGNAEPVEPTTETTTTEGDKQEQPRNEQGQFKPSVQKRIDELTFRRNQAERDASYWKAKATELQQAAAPRAADFDSDEDYDQAMRDHRVDTRVNKQLATDAEAKAKEFTEAARAAAGESYNQRVAEVKARIPDFVDVVSKANVEISPALQEALLDSDKGPDLVYHLAKNPEEATRLNAMSTRQMDREIGRLELSIGAKPAPAAPPARTTNAPAPATVGTAAAAPANTDPSKMSQAEFEAWARKNGSNYIR